MKWDELPEAVRKAILSFVARRNNHDTCTGPLLEAYIAVIGARREWFLHEDPEVRKALRRVCEASLDLMDLVTRKHEGLMQLARQQDLECRECYVSQVHAIGEAFYRVGAYLTAHEKTNPRGPDLSILFDTDAERRLRAVGTRLGLVPDDD